MTYYFSKTVKLPFDDAIERTTKILQENGFGVLTTIDVQATLKEKLGVGFRPYTILGACNPGMAYEALEAEPHIGTMLPCNVIVQYMGNREVEISAIDPLASMASIDNTQLKKTAGDVSDLLQVVIQEI